MKSPESHSMKDLRLGHAHLKVTDIDRAIDFYTHVLGLRVTERLANYAFLTSGAEHHTLALQGIGPRAIAPPDHAVGLYHIAFELPDPESFRNAWQKLETEKIAFHPVDHLISWALYFNDPDGNGLELYLDRREAPDGAPLWHGCNRLLKKSPLLQAPQ
jgi:catechol 2,3-dioxygenase